MKVDDGGPAFPYTSMNQWAGMSLRDWFAGQSLAGMQARDSFDDGLATPAQRANVAYLDADAMIARRQINSADERTR